MTPYADCCTSKLTSDLRHGYPFSSHADIPNTSEMIYLVDGERMQLGLVPTAVGDLVVARVTPPDPNVKRVNNGITGDARRPSKALGKRAFDNKVEHAVRQIKPLIPQ